MKYKKYIVFSFEHYYPGGGLGDISDSFDTLPEAQQFVKSSLYDNNEIINRDTWEEIDCID